jgi:hypothetical protein
MTSHDDEQKLRKETAENDRRLREQERAATMHEFAMSEASLDLGRYSAVSKQSVIGGEPDVAAAYPAASAAHQVQLPPEQPLGVDINSVEPCGTAVEIEASLRALASPTDAIAVSPSVATGPTSAAPSSLVAADELRGVGPFSKGGR